MLAGACLCTCDCWCECARVLFANIPSNLIVTSGSLQGAEACFCPHRNSRGQPPPLSLTVPPSMVIVLLFKSLPLSVIVKQ